MITIFVYPTWESYPKHMKILKLAVLILVIIYMAPIACLFPMIQILKGPLYISIPYFSGCSILYIFQGPIFRWIETINDTYQDW